MKKSIFPLLLALLLGACFSNDNNIVDDDLIISECLSNVNLTDRAVELYNKSKKQIDLSKYSLKIYKGSSEEYHEIKFVDKKLDGKTTFVICFNESSERLKSYSDMESSELIFDGTWPIQLCKGEKVVDVLGKKGYKNNICDGLDIIKKSNVLFGRKEYVEFDFIKYSGDYYFNLGSITNPISEEEYLDGPHLTENDFNTPFVGEDLIGCGGAVRVNFNYNIDGDTTSFIFVDDLSSYGIKNKENIRYFGIDTPELQHGDRINAGEYGEQAKEYTNSLLTEGKSYALSTAIGQQLREGYGRIMCYVWVAFVSNPQPIDYQLMNLLIVKEGYSFYGVVKNDRNFYNNIPYSSYFRNAELFAMKEHKNIHS